MKKNAYPQEMRSYFLEAPRNLNKWMQSFNSIYAQEPSLGWKEAFNRVTAGWENMEKQEFTKWMAFYQENGHQKYNTAAPTWVRNSFQKEGQMPRFLENGGSLIPTNALKSILPNRPNMESFPAHQEIDTVEEEKKRKEETKKKIQSLIGRLNSAEKLATQPDVQLVLKQSLNMSVDDWVSLLQKLKREIQLSHMRTASVSMFDDLIHKNANQIKAKGYNNAAKLLIKIAEMPLAVGPSNSAMGISPMNPIDAPFGGQPMGQSPASLSTGPAGAKPEDAPMTPDPADPKQNATMLAFIKGLSGDENEAEDAEDDELDAKERSKDTTASIVVRAQMVPEPSLDVPAPEQAIAGPEKALPEALPNQMGDDLVVNENELNQEPKNNLHVPDPFDQALSNVKITDIIARLESVASMFKNRKIARELSVIDLMMDQVGIATFFPTLAEAMRSALESNSYCQTRVEEVLAKLRGSVITPLSQQMEAEIIPSSSVPNPEEEVIKNNLAKEDAANAARKERRKQLQQAEEDKAIAQPVPQEAVELAGPAQIQSGPTAPIRPV